MSGVLAGSQEAIMSDVPFSGSGFNRQMSDVPFSVPFFRPLTLSVVYDFA